jgi:hypothetical protein
MRFEKHPMRSEAVRLPPTLPVRSQAMEAAALNIGFSRHSGSLSARSSKDPS